MPFKETNSIKSLIILNAIEFIYVFTITFSILNEKETTA